ncbi:hypothetical protein LY12_001550 [Prauserella alba]|uniref:Uncharacterized protein n=1 Tax=Prauserella alba TaxID=176898 RepID=A0ABP4FN45_9PSEU|nr:hypothetical protein [Prauserella alba]
MVSSYYGSDGYESHGGHGDYRHADSAKPRVNAGTLWAGGAATALVAALVGVVATLVVTGVFDIPVMAPANAEGAVDYIGAVWLAGFGVVGSLLATVLAHLLLLVAPRPMAFLGWIVGLVTVVFAVWPFTIAVEIEVQVASALVYVVMGIAIGSLVTGMATKALDD